MFSRLRRFLRRLVWLGLCLGALLAGVTWYLNARWLPAGGKALVAQRLGRALHAHVTIEELSYDPWNGFVLRRVRAVDPTTQQATLVAPYIRAQVAWVPLLATRQARFRVFLDLEEPGPVRLLAVGRYGLASQDAEVTLTLRECALARLSPATRARLPAALEQAAGTVQLRLSSRAGQLEAVHVSAQLATFAWAAPPMHLSGRAEVEAEGPYRAGQTPGWQLSGLVQLHDAVYAGLPVVQTARKLNGTVRFTPTSLESLDLSTAILDIPVHVTGRIDTVGHPVLALHVEAQPTMAQLTALAPALKPYHLNGSTSLMMEITGPTQPPEALTVTAQGVLQQVHVKLPDWPRPIESVSGPWRYTQATQTLTFAELSLVHDGVPATATGTITHFADPTVHLTVTAAPPLAQLANLFPMLDAWECRGDSAVTLTIDRSGAPVPLAVTAELQLRHGHIKTPWLPLPFTDAEGTVRFQQGALEVPALRGIYSGTTYEFGGRIDHMQEPHFNITLRTTDLSMMLDAVLAKEALVINRWQGRLGDATRWQVTGQITGYDKTPQLQVAGTGTVNLEELARLPWPWAQRLGAWGLTGMVQAQGEGRGPLRAWRDGEWEARVTAPSLHWREVPFTDVAGELRLAGKKLTVPELRASPAGGRFVAGGSTEFAGDVPTYTLHLQFADVDLAQATQALPPAKRIPSGTASGQLELTSYGPPSTVRGQALVHAQGDNLANVPFLNRVLGGLLATVAQAFKFGDLRQVTIQEVRGHLTVANEQVATEDLLLLGSNANFEVRGTVGFDKSLHLTVDPSLSKQLLSSTPPLGTAREVVGQLDVLRIGRIEVTGTWEQPKFAARLVPLNELVGQLLPNLFNLLRRGEND